MEPE
ncbi:hypothetical protein CJF30_00003011 [Rutstroemia sp. NJR-2017a BBW]|jgi:hypothetical protein